MNEKIISYFKNMKALESLYRSRWIQYGYSPQSLGWTKGKQEIRFDLILSGLTCEKKSILDVGCGFGEINLAIKERTDSYNYFGIDIMPEFIKEARDNFENDQVSFEVGDFMSVSFDRSFDYVVGSGIFAFELEGCDNYEYIKNTLEKMFEISTEVVSVDFLSSHVNFRRPGTFYTDPKLVLDIAFQLTKNVSLRHDYMPFEFNLKLFKDDSFGADTIFERYKNEQILK